MLTPGQMQIRDLVMGPGTAFNIKDCSLYDTNVDVTGQGKRPFGHGSWAGTEWETDRVVPITIQITGANEAAVLASIRELKTAFRPVETGASINLTWADESGEYLMVGRPRMSKADQRNLAVGISEVSCAFMALDPMHYSATETVVGPISLPSFTGGLTFPITFPITFSGTLSGGVAQVANAGSANCALLYRVDGPVEHPQVTLQRNDGQILNVSVDVNVATGQWLEIDTGARTSILNGTVSQRGVTSTEGADWPLLTPGTSTIRFRGEGSGTLTVRFRNAWWG